MKQLIQLSIVLLLFLSFSALASHEEGHVLSYDEFAKNPSLNDFSQLSWKDQSQFLESNYQQDYALQFFSNPANAELYPNLAEKFFLGGDPPSAELSRNNFQQRPEAAGKFFSKKYGKEFTFEGAAGDFEFNAAEGYLKNNGLKLPLEAFQSDARYSGVKAVQNGFILIPKDAPEGTDLTLTGETGLDLAVEFDAERNILRLLE